VTVPTQRVWKRRESFLRPGADPGDQADQGNDVEGIPEVEGVSEVLMIGSG